MLNSTVEIKAMLISFNLKRFFVIALVNNSLNLNRCYLMSDKFFSNLTAI